MIGDRLRHLRTQRGMSLADVAAGADISTSHLSRLEKGKRRLTERSLIVRLAQVLGHSPSELMGQPIDWTDPQMVDAQTSVAALRLTLATTKLGERSDRPSRPVQELHEATVDAVRARTDCDFVRLGSILSDLIAELHSAIIDNRGEPRRQALESLYVACSSAMTLAHAHGYQTEAWLAAQRGQEVAEEIGEQSWRALAAFTKVHALLPMGGHKAAYEIASVAADETSSLSGTMGAGDQAIAAHGSLLLASALTASITGRTEEAADRLVAAADIADDTGEGSPLVAMFGPTNVAIYSMASALERGDHGAAASLARTVDLTKISSKERRAKFHMDLARAFHGAGKPENAVNAYRMAESEARSRLYGSVYARETVTDLREQLDRDSESGRQVRDLAYRMSLPT